MKLCPICATSYPAGHRTCPTDGTVLVDTAELPPGTMIRDCYRIERTLGKGGMGIVYLAQHTLLGEPRALKFLSGALASNPAFVQRFLQEAKAASKLRHPNIAATLELGQAEDGSFYISMEYVDGPSLRTVLEKFPHGLPLERALSLIRDIAEALSAAHSKHLVHRDIKPENVLLASTAEGVIAKVVDFGIVAMNDGANGQSRLTQTGKPLLTAEYAAPEQWRGVVPASELDGRTDLYSMGCMFFEMLTGRLPFHAESYEGWFEQHVYATAPSPSFFRPELARYPGLDAVVLHLLAKERDHRTAHVSEFLAELDRTLNGYQQTSSYAATAVPVAEQPRQTVIDRFEPYPGAYSTPPQPVNPPSPVQPSSFQGTSARQAGYGTFGAPVSQLAADNFSNEFSPAYGQVAAPVMPVPAPKPKNPGILFALLAVFLLIGLGVAGLFVMQRRQQAAQDNAGVAQQVETSQANPTGQAQATSGASPSAITPLNPSLSAAPDASKPSASKVATNGQPKSKSTSPSASHPEGSPIDKTTSGTPDPATLARQAFALFQDEQYTEAEPLLEQSCKAAQGDSCDHLGWMYQHKLGVEQDYKHSWTLYSEACDDGNFQGCDHLASLYKNNLGVTQDYPRAAILYGKACNGGVLEACSDLGVLYQMNQGVEQDYAHAMSLYQKACDGGFALACNNLGVMYQRVSRDLAKAAISYEKACDGGNAHGCSDLGDLYRTGSGVAQDLDKARTYLSKGCNMGNQWGCDHLKLVQ